MPKNAQAEPDIAALFLLASAPTFAQTTGGAEEKSETKSETGTGAGGETKETTTKKTSKKHKKVKKHKKEEKMGADGGCDPGAKRRNTRRAAQAVHRPGLLERSPVAPRSSRSCSACSSMTSCETARFSWLNSGEAVSRGRGSATVTMRFTRPGR